jgi:NAD(P)-dependent dehydrogenase (short-subunit alcohol dehydrogenase family)
MIQGKVVIITGASGGLGSVVSGAFRDAGARVAAFARGEEPAAFVARVTAQEGRVDALVHLAGAFAGGQDVAATEEAVLTRMLEANVYLFFTMAKAVLPGMQAQGSGAVVAIGSRTAVEPAVGMGAYSASKAALVSLVRTIALESKDHGITANVVLPGTMDTAANRGAMPDADFSTWVRPEQVAAMLVYLAGASQVSGAVIPIYGGEL